MITPLTADKSSAESENRFRIRMPHSSAVCSRIVRRRQRPVSLDPSNAPMVMLVFPASSASSIFFLGRADAAGKNRRLLSVIFAHPQETGGIQAAGDSFDDPSVLFNADAAALGVARSASEPAQNRVAAVLHQNVRVLVDGSQQRGQQIFALHIGAFDSQRGRQGSDIGGKASVAHIDSDSRNDGAAFKLRQNAGAFLSVYHHI